MKLYQSVGFENAGHLFEYRVPTRLLIERSTELDTVGPMVGDDGHVDRLERLQVEGPADREVANAELDVVEHESPCPSPPGERSS